MKNLKFINNSQSYNPDDAFIVHFSGINSKDELLKQYNEKLLFPYFGFNWDALFDMLRDFHWIKEEKVVLVHDDLPKLTESDLKIYLEVLAYSVKDWKEGEEHSLEVVFPKSVKDLMKS